MKFVYMILLQAALLLCPNGSAQTDDSTESMGEEKPIEACPVKLKTSGKCDGEQCPYQIHLPPMTLQLPKQFRLTEKTLKEVQNLKEVINKMKKSCQDCKLQADDNQERESNEFLPPATDGPTDEGKVQDNRVKELQSKVSKLSTSLKNAKNQIHSLQGRLEQINLINMNNVEYYVDNRIANLTFAVNTLGDKCSSNCPATQPNPNLDIKTSGNGCVKLEKIECDSCRIETERGTSILQSIKSQKLDIQAKGGKVICLGTIQGNADIHVTQESTVSIEKLQGSSVNISTTNGLIKTKYLYAESSFLSSAAGDILLGSIHGDTTLQTKTGNIKVDSADGSLKASTFQGDIDVYVVSRVGDVDLKSENGAVTVKVPATLTADMQLSGSKIEVSPEVHWQDIQKVSREGRIIVTANPQNLKLSIQNTKTQCNRLHLRSSGLNR